MPLDMKTSNPPVLGSNTGRHTYVTVRLTAKWATSDESVIARPSTPPPPPPPPPAASALIESLLAAFRSAAAPGAVLDMATAATTPAAKTGLSANARRLRLNIVSPRDKPDGPPGAPQIHRIGTALRSRADPLSHPQRTAGESVSVRSRPVRAPGSLSSGPD